ncbi:hypothetical protein [Mesorhizobium sp. 10J20-29]
MPPLVMAFDPNIDDAARAVVTFGFGSERHERVYFDSNGPALRKTGDALLCLGLAPAMELGTDLVVRGGVSSELLDNTNSIQSILCRWYPGYRKINIYADPVEQAYPDNRGSGLFYSGGVDSSYALNELSAKLDAIVTVVGADVDPSEFDRVARMTASAKAVSTHYGLEAIIVTTDTRRVSDRLVGWVQYHGAFLAAVRHMLADRLDTQYIASSGSETARTIPWGSQPLLDPLYGTQGARVEHHVLLDRFSKLSKISRIPHLMEHLRVCPRSDPNCGICKKCTFMLHGLDALNAFDAAPTFPREMLGASRLVAIDDDNDYLVEARRAVQICDPHGLTAAAIDRALRTYAIRQSIQGIFPSSEWHRKFKRLKRQWRFRRAATS